MVLCFECVRRSHVGDAVWGKRGPTEHMNGLENDFRVEWCTFERGVRTVGLKRDGGKTKACKSKASPNGGEVERAPKARKSQLTHVQFDFILYVLYFCTKADIVISPPRSFYPPLHV